MAITQQNARELAHKSHVARRAKKLALLKLEIADAIPAYAVQSPAIENPDITRELERVRSYLERLSAELMTCEGEAWDVLSRAHQRFFQALTHLSQIPSPGQYRPEKPAQAYALAPLNLEPSIEHSQPEQSQVIDIQPHDNKANGD